MSEGNTVSIKLSTKEPDAVKKLILGVHQKVEVYQVRSIQGLDTLITIVSVVGSTASIVGLFHSLKKSNLEKTKIKSIEIKKRSSSGETLTIKAHEISEKGIVELVERAKNAE
ncbi:hypothetical protein QX776_14490 [Alteromonadaceae bacterium BrNp21-10]|nr:hypothetical protein [Alteromonadaceae bacterium BrNp21-10]